MSNTGMKKPMGMILLILVLFFAHVFYNYSVAYWLFQKSGGVHKEADGWTRFGGIEYAWTTPLYMPGCMILHLGEKLHGLRSAAQPYGIIGVLLLLCASVVSSWTMAYVIIAVVLRKKQLFGAYYYRLVLAVAGWVWVFVPVEWTWVYQWTVIY